MHLQWLKPLLGRPAPFTTVYVDATPIDVGAEQEVAERWKGLRRSIHAADRVSAAVLDEIGDRLAVPDGRRAPHGRVIVADAHGVVVDRLLSAPPPASRVDVGATPALLPVIRAAEESVRLLIAALDRTGADLTRVTTGERDHSPATTTVDGGHDDVHKTREGALSRRTQTRAEDSWQRNAETVAHALEKAVADDAPDLVVLTGDLRTVTLVKDAVTSPVRDRVVEVPGGGRGEGVREGVFKARVSEVAAGFRARRRRSVLDRFAEALGRGEGGVSGLADVVEVLRRGQVAELLLDAEALDGPLGARELWVGTAALELASGAGDLDGLAVSAPLRRMTAPIALVRAALGQDAGITVAEEGEVTLADGVGALLRWSDDSTPGGTLLSQSADTGRLRSLG
ncbi:MAG TPA: hypothetical protein VGC04_07145 [Cellulomonas sp.]